MNRIMYKQIRGLHLELTTKCNANCGMCGRNFRGKVRSFLQLVELSIDDCKRIITPDFLRQLEFISICGVYGDPICATDLIKIINYIYSCNEKILIHLYTNGSLHDENWWKELAGVIKNGYVIFGIDGLGDVHTVHRANTKFDTVMENAKSYIKAGGKARWDYIVFKHNEDQVEAARKLSEMVGFSSFQIKKTSRFFKHLYEKDNELDSTLFEFGKHPIYDSEGNINGFLELPTQKKFRNASEEKVFSLIQQYGSLDSYFNQVQIDCQAIKTKGVFISAFGEVFPCCTVYQQVCYGSIYGVTDKDELNEYALYKEYSVSAYKIPIRDIVEGSFFTKLQSSWNCKSIELGKPKSCCRTCGVALDLHGSQHKNDKI